MKTDFIYLSALTDYLDDYLNFDKKLIVEKIDPHMTNGLAVRGKEKIKKIGFAVSASLSLFQKAKEENCDCIIVHHSFNFPPYNRYDSIFQNRIAFLLKNNISLFGYHFLLDAHPEVGNNVEILKSLGAKPTQAYLHRGSPWGWIGELEQSVDFESIVNNFKKYISKRAVVYEFGPKNIKRIVAVSGKGAPFASDMQELIEKSVDLFITGEVHEWNKEHFREADINFLAGGHYATEKFGILALLGHLKNHFHNIEVKWLEVENEV